MAIEPKELIANTGSEIERLPRREVVQLFQDWIFEFDFAQISPSSEEKALREFYNRENAVAPQLGRPERRDFFGILDRSAALSFPITISDASGHLEALAVLSIRQGNGDPVAGPFGYLRDLRILGGSRCFTRWRRIYRSLLEREGRYRELFGFLGFYTLVTETNERWRESLPLLESYGIHYNLRGELVEHLISIESERARNDIQVQTIESEPDSGYRAFTAFDQHLENFSSAEVRLTFVRECRWLQARSISGAWVAALVWDSSSTKRYAIDQGAPRYFLIDLKSNASIEEQGELLHAAFRSLDRCVVSLPGFEGVESWLSGFSSVVTKKFHVYRVEKDSRSYPFESFVGLTAFI